MKKPKEKGRYLKEVEFSCRAPDAQDVFLAGTFNAWNPSACPMRRGPEGMWHITLRLARCSYEYKFVIDGTWLCKPGTDELDRLLASYDGCVANVYGTMNRTLEIV